MVFADNNEFYMESLPVRQISIPMNICDEASGYLVISSADLLRKVASIISYRNNPAAKQNLRHIKHLVHLVEII